MITLVGCLSPALTSIALWRARLGISQLEAACRLGVAPKTYQEWDRGVTWATGEPVIYQKRVLLAAAAIELGLESSASDRSQPELRSWRKRLGLSRQEAADRLGVSKKRYQEWEDGFDYTLKRAIVKLDHRTWLACAAIEDGVSAITAVDAPPARAPREPPTDRDRAVAPPVSPVSVSPRISILDLAEAVRAATAARPASQPRSAVARLVLPQRPASRPAASVYRGVPAARRELPKPAECQTFSGRSEATTDSRPAPVFNYSPSVPDEYLDDDELADVSDLIGYRMR